MSASTQLTVGIHILCLLADTEGALLTSEQMAGSVGTHPVALRRTLARLRAKGLVMSQGGVGGGWQLARPAKKITLADVYRAVRTSALLPMHRDDPNPACEVGSRIQAGLKGYYDDAEAALERRLGRSTIADVLASVRASPRRPKR
jgi:Rrf2 family protein